MTREARWYVAAVGVAAFLLVGTTWAQDPQPPAADEEAQPVEATEAAEAPKATEADDSLREQTIYIPYENLRKTFEKEGRGVFLPYEKFRQLWDAAHAAKTHPDGGDSRRAALITEIDSEASVRTDIVEIHAVLKIETIGKGWHEVPLRLADAAITEARIGDQPARLLTDPKQGYRLLVENQDKSPQSLTLTLVYAKGINRAPGQNSVAFQAPQAPVNRWKVRIPEAGVKVDIQPMIAATEVVEKKSTAEEDGEEPQDTPSPAETVVLAFVGAAPEVRIAWTPKAEGATGLAALASVQTEQQVFVSEGVTRTRTQLTYAISRAELNQLTIAVPADQKVVNVFDANVRQWSVETEGERQKIVVQLFEPAKGSQNVLVELEKFHAAPDSTQSDDAPADAPPAEAASQPLSVPVIEAMGVGRQQGVVVVQIGEGLRAEAVSKVGLVQVDAEDLPASLKKTAWGFSFRYVAAPYELTLDVEKIEPRITADSLVEATLEPTRLALAVTTVYRVERAGVFRLELEVPEGFTVRTVQGRQVGNAAAAQIDTHHLAGEKTRRLVISLARKALGPVGVMVFMDRRLDHPELQTPTGKTATIPIPAPLVPAEAVERATGRLMVYAPESLRVNPTEVTALRSVSAAEATAGMASARGGARGVLAYVFGEDKPALSVEAERRKPQVTVRQLMVARVEDGVTTYDVTLFYDVLYSGIKSLRIDVPQEVAGLLRNKTKTIREQVIDPPPEDLSKGCVAWSLTGSTELLGSGYVNLTWQDKVEKLEAGSSVDLEIPRIRPMGVDRAWGQIVLTKAETIDLSESEIMSGLRPIDPQHDLMNGSKVDGAVRAYEFHDDWQFQVTATRYDLEDIKQTSIAKGVLRMVLMRTGKTSVQALYRLRSADQRLELQMPEGAEFDTDPRIDGKAVTMEMGKNQTYFIPLLGTQEDQSFLLELRYTLSVSGPPIAWPVFPTQPAVQKVYLALYLPEEMNLLDTKGPWTREFRWGLNGAGDFDPVNAMVVGNDTVGTWPQSVLEGGSMPSSRRNDAVAARLLAWVSESIPVQDTFSTDGQLFVFSALQPRSPEEDGLQLRRLHRGYMNTAAMIATIALGLLLLPMGFRRRVFVVGLLAIAIVFFAIYWPLAIWNLCDKTLILPLLMVAGLWAIQFLGWTLPRRARQWYVARPAKSPFQSPAEPPKETAGEKPEGTDSESGSPEQGDEQAQSEGERNDG